MYFIRQTSSWQQNNSLKKYLGPILKDLNGQQVEDPANVVAYLTAKLAFANRHFKKCTSVQLTTRSLKPMVDATEYITLGDVGELALYAITGTFRYAPKSDPSLTQPAGATPPADGLQAYTLFAE